LIGKKNGGRLYGIGLATVCAAFAARVVYALWHGSHVGLIVLISVAVWIAFYLIGVWVVVDRPAELSRKLPISSKELHRRKKEFYDWLASQGRRR
jgi:hypothetical protein